MKSLKIKNLWHIAFLLGTAAFGLNSSGLAQDKHGGPVSLPAVNNLEEMLLAMNMPPQARGRILAGEILVESAKENTDKELAIAAVMYLPMRVDRIRQHLLMGQDMLLDPTHIAHNSWEAGEADEIDFSGLTYRQQDSEEVDRLLKATPGNQFNFSQEEFHVWKELRRRHATGMTEPARLDVTSALHAMLRKRYQDYQSQGAKGLAPYARGLWRTTSPGSALDSALESHRLIKITAPDFLQLIRHYPQNQSVITDRYGEDCRLDSRYFWIRQKVDGQPAVILAHRLAATHPHFTLVSERQFYVSQSYDAMQTILGLLPYQDGSVLFYENHTSTEQVAGFASMIAHKIGRDRMKQEIKNLFETIRRKVVSDSSVP